MKTIFRYVVCLFLVSGMVYAGEDSKTADQAYQDGQFAKAQSEYQIVLETHPRSAAVLYNLGNVYFKQGEWGESLTYYLRAKRMSPRDADIAFNSRQVKAQLQDHYVLSPFSVDFFNEATQWITLDEILLLFCVPFTIFLLFLMRMVAKRHEFLDYQRRLFVSGGFSVILGVLLLVKCIAGVWPTYAIIIDRKVALKSGPAEGLTTQCYVHEGIQMRVLTVNDTWANVALPNGVQGWVKRDVFWEL